ncbi:MAG TPA: HlyD family efflux transporter periplasmic adaptor subunit [Gemmatimonadaceae bacterium]|nr:HlyD family efflux transporter periplasmic adaptor subunit [Gemmatimonadaceae bacterium]
MNRALFLLLPVAALVACGAPPADANGRFEATEVTVSAEAAGRLLTLTPQEGDTVRADVTLAVVDTTALAISRAELAARDAVLAARQREALAMMRTAESQQALATREAERVRRLHAGGAATTQLLERVERELEASTQQVAARRATQDALRAEVDAIAAQRAQLDDRLTRATVRAPIGGTVLQRFVEPGELVQPGTPLLTLAALDTLTLRAYVAESQLAQVRVGAKVRVQVDGPDGTLKPRDGIVSWIAAQAEFTPTPIQTREERVAQVYAVTVRVANPDGRLRIGMPGELVLSPLASAAQPE